MKHVKNVEFKQKPTSIRQHQKCLRTFHPQELGKRHREDMEANQGNYLTGVSRSLI